MEKCALGKSFLHSQTVRSNRRTPNTTAPDGRLTRLRPDSLRGALAPGAHKSTPQGGEETP